MSCALAFSADTETNVRLKSVRAAKPVILFNICSFLFFYNTNLVPKSIYAIFLTK